MANLGRLSLRRQQFQQAADLCGRAAEILGAMKQVRASAWRCRASSSETLPAPYARSVL